MSISRDMILLRRLGTFLVARDVWENPDTYRQVLGHFLPVRVEAMFHADAYEVTAYCDQFDPVERWGIPPRYNPVWHSHPDGTTDLVWGRPGP